MKAKDLANNPQGEEQNSADEFYWWKTITKPFPPGARCARCEQSGRIILLGKMDGRSVLANI